jgi:lipopolysaccharide export LptBFGC system permease protein LptF
MIMSHPREAPDTAPAREQIKPLPPSSPSIPQRPAVSPVLAVLFGILAVSLASVFIRYAQAFAPSLVIAAYRLTLATLVVAPVAYARQRKSSAP